MAKAVKAKQATKKVAAKRPVPRRTGTIATPVLPPDFVEQFKQMQAQWANQLAGGNNAPELKEQKKPNSMEVLNDLVHYMERTRNSIVTLSSFRSRLIGTSINTPDAFALDEKSSFLENMVRAASHANYLAYFLEEEIDGLAKNF
jgi:hypothetical protein